MIYVLCTISFIKLERNQTKFLGHLNEAPVLFLCVEVACVGGKEWYFYSLRDRKYATGQRTNRATVSGYWKATGKDKHVTRKGVLIGMRKTLVFYQGRAPKGRKTDWVMHEFRVEASSDVSKFSVKVQHVQHMHTIIIF